ncbi:MAG: RidA family protein [Bacillota bacterium]
MKEVIFTKNAYNPGGMPYSQAIKVGNTIYVAGQGPLYPEEGQFFNDEGMSEMEAETKLAIENIKAILEAAGAKLSDVVKVNVFLGNGADFDEFNTYYEEYFHEPYPARSITTANSSMLVQMDAIAVIE